MSYFFLPMPDTDFRAITGRKVLFPRLRLLIRRLFVITLNAAILAGLVFLVTYLFTLANFLAYYGPPY